MSCSLCAAAAARCGRERHAVCALARAQSASELLDAVVRTPCPALSEHSNDVASVVEECSAAAAAVVFIGKQLLAGQSRFRAAVAAANRARGETPELAIACELLKIVVGVLEAHWHVLVTGVTPAAIARLLAPDAEHEHASIAVDVGLSLVGWVVEASDSPHVGLADMATGLFYSLPDWVKLCAFPEHARRFEPFVPRILRNLRMHCEAPAAADCAEADSATPFAVFKSNAANAVYNLAFVWPGVLPCVAGQRVWPRCACGAVMRSVCARAFAVC